MPHSPYKFFLILFQLLKKWRNLILTYLDIKHTQTPLFGQNLSQSSEMAWSRCSLEPDPGTGKNEANFCIDIRWNKATFESYPIFSKTGLRLFPQTGRLKQTRFVSRNCKYILGTSGRISMLFFCKFWTTACAQAYANDVKYYTSVYLTSLAYAPSHSR